MIDWDTVLALKSDVGDEGFSEILEVFLEEVEEGLNELAPDLSSEALGAKLHFLKGSALNLGLLSFAELCTAGERSAAGGKSHEIQFSKFKSTYEASKAELMDVL